MIIKPYGRRVAVKLCEQERKKGSLILVNKKQDIELGMVVNRGCSDAEDFFSIGDTIMFKAYAVTSTIDEDIFLVNLDDILAVIEE